MEYSTKLRLTSVNRHFSWLAGLAILLAMLACCCCPVLAEYAVDPEAPSVHLSPYVEFYEDPDAALDISQILVIPPEAFQPVEAAAPTGNWGYTQSAVWFKIELYNPTSEPIPRMLEYQPTWTSEVSLYTPGDQGLIKAIDTGTSRPFYTRPLNTRTFVFPVVLKPGNNTYYFRIHSINRITADIVLWMENPYEETANYETMLFWSLYGALFILILFNALLFAGNRNRTTGLLVLYLVNFLLFLLCFDGTGYQYIWPYNTAWERVALTVSLLLQGMLVVLFFISFTEISKTSQKISRFLYGLALACAAVIAVKLAFPEMAIMAPIQPLALVIELSLITTAAWLWIKKKNRNALFFLAAYLGLTIVSVPTVLTALGWIGEHYPVHIGLHAAIILLALILNLGLADSKARATRAREKAEQTIRSQYDELKTVHFELQSAMNQAEALNNQLIASQDDLMSAHELLRRSEERLQTIFSLAPIGIINLDPSGRIFSANQLCCQMTGYAMQELLQMKYQDLLHASEKLHVEDAISTLREGKAESYHLERRFVQKNGQTIWGDAYVAAFFDDEGVITEIMVAIADITKRKTAEMALKESEERFRLSLEATSDALWDYNVRSSRMYFSPRFYTMLGYEPGEFPQSYPSWERLLHSSDLEPMRQIMNDLIDNRIQEFSREYRLLCRDGSFRWILVRGKSVERDSKSQAVRITGTHVDIHLAKTQEEALKQSEIRFRLLSQNIQDAIIMLDLKGNVIYVTPSIQRLVGYTPEEYLGLKVEQLMTPESVKEFRHSVRTHLHALKNRDPEMMREDYYHTIEYEYIKKNGDRMWLSNVARYYRDESGEIVGIQGVLRDVTERRNAETELKNMQRLLFSIIDSMPSMLAGIDSTGKITIWNQAAAAMTGLPAEKALGRPALETVPLLMPVEDQIKQAISNHALQKVEKLSYVTDDDSNFYDILIYPLNAAGLEGAVIRIEDITDKVRMEEMIVQTEKMLSVGGLAAGMAHEINNPLGGIIQGAQNLERRLSPDLDINRQVALECGADMEQITRYMRRRHIPDLLEGIRESGARASNIVSNMLQFSRLSQSHKETRVLSDLIERTISLAASDYDLKRSYDFKHITIIRDYENQSQTIYCIGTEIEQVVLNLLKNAAQAVFLHTSKPTITIRTWQDHEWTAISVEDNGPGLDAATMRRVFEPFYTTKEPGSGTGLGLSVSYFIVTNNHNGQMTVESSPGKGARFTVKLPMEGSHRIS